MKKGIIITAGILVILVTIILFNKSSVLNKRSHHLSNVMKLSGKNRVELKKLLNHYKEGTDEYDAAQYLVSNIHGHFFHDNHSSKQYHSLLSIAASCADEHIDRRKNITKNAWDSIQNALGFFSIRTLPSVADIDTVKANYLISHIDNSIKAWRSPWSNHLTFDDFCRYILPYRVDTEPLEDWRKIITKNAPWLLELKHSGITAFEACCVINDSLKNQVAVTSTFDYLPRQSASDLFFSHTGNCVDISTFTTLVMRTAGLPVASVRCPGGHTWNVLFDQDGILKDFMGAEHNPVQDFGGMYFHRFKVDMMKAYLKIYHPNNQLLSEEEQINTPTFFWNPYLQDISSEVLYRRELKIPLKKNTKLNHSWLYLNQLLPNWRDGVTIDRIKYPPNSLSHFHNISKRGTYSATAYRNGRYDHISHCVTILANDSLHTWIPNWNQKEKCKIYRKTPMSPKMRTFSEELVGAKIQGANRRDFSDAVNLGTVEKTLEYFDGSKLNNDYKFRYARLIPPDTSSIHIAKIQFFSDDMVIKGAPFAEKKIIGIKNAFDGNIRTNFDGDRGSWIGMDFGQPVKIDSYKILPRNNFNVIEPGDTYELFVLDTAHISLGIMSAKDNYVEYDNIPSNALLYLINKSRGKEFNHFTIINGEQVWDLTNYMRQ